MRLDARERRAWPPEARKQRTGRTRNRRNREAALGVAGVCRSGHRDSRVVTNESVFVPSSRRNPLGAEVRGGARPWGGGTPASPASSGPLQASASEGDWLSVYDRAATDRPEDLYADHVVALTEAWDSGASVFDAALVGARLGGGDLGQLGGWGGAEDDVPEAFEGGRCGPSWRP